MAMKKKIDLTGETYGRLSVLKEVEQVGYVRHYLCECSCGKQVTVQQANLRRGQTTSCGCVRIENTTKSLTVDLTDKRFGRLTAMTNTGRKLDGNYVWSCRCDCGKTIEVKSGRLTNGNTQSCGCMREITGHMLQKHHKQHSFTDAVFVPALTQKIRKTNKTGVKGVREIKGKHGSKYQASITIKYKTINLGSFDTLEEAKTARKQGEKIYHEPYLNKQSKSKHKNRKE